MATVSVSMSGSSECEKSMIGTLQGRTESAVVAMSAVPCFKRRTTSFQAPPLSKGQTLRTLVEKVVFYQHKDFAMEE